VPAGNEPNSDFTSDFDELLAVLDLNRIADDLFIGSHPSKNPMRTFGGQLMAQSFVASSRTLIRDDLPPSALSVHFINGGDTAKDIEFHVTRLRDERRFANRRVDAVQDGMLLSSAMISYMSGGRGLEHAIDPPQVAEPHTQPSIRELLRGYEETVPHFVNALQPIEWRYTNDPAWVMREKGDRLPHNRVWVKAIGVIPGDQVLHTAVMVYASDTTVLDSVITTHGLSWGFDRIFAASTNHSVWFHRPVDFNDWVLYSTSSPVAADSRGLGTGHFFDRSGQLLATVVQEGVLKYFPPSRRIDG
jgi:acyl-CoA thioesterase II